MILLILIRGVVMDVKEKAMKFAIKAHDGKFRKAELSKPFVFHSIDVANLLSSYDFDDNVVAAGYLHDVIEDTIYTEEDILMEFGEDVCSLVVGATEEDRTLSWEERKLGTINRVKKLDLRHKAIIACDKISNIEDLRFKFGKYGKEDFSAFNRGKEKKLWYWNEVYKSLIYCEDKGQPMFYRLKKNLDAISNSSIVNGEYYPDIDVFNKKLEKTDIARMLHYKKLEMLKMKSILNLSNSYVVEFTGSSSMDKEKIINNIGTYFIVSGFKVGFVKDFTKSEYYFKNIYPKVVTNYSNVIKNVIPNCVLNELNEVLELDYDIVFIDRSLFDKVVFIDMLCRKKMINKDDSQKIINNYLSSIRKKIDMIVALEDVDNVEYNKSLNRCLDMYCRDEIKICSNKVYFDIDSDNMLDICNYIIDDMRNKCLNRSKQELKILKKVK